MVHLIIDKCASHMGSMFACVWHVPRQVMGELIKEEKRRLCGAA